MISSAVFFSTAPCGEKVGFVHVTAMEISFPLQAA